MIYSARCEKGPVRETNEDSYAVKESGVCLLMAVADGLGGEVCGEIASKLAVDTVMNELVSDSNDFSDEGAVSELFSKLFNKANKEILRYGMNDPQARGMCTTLTVAVLNDRKLFIGHIGDTRVYICHKRDIQKLTNDHNKAAELVKEGKITESEAKVHPGRNVLVKVLGENVGDIVMLCSDGLYSFIGKDDFIAALNNRKDLQKVCDCLINSALAGGSSDNMTIIAGLVRPSGGI